MNTAVIPEPFAFESSVVRVLLIDGDPWFIATDVAKALGYREAYYLTRMLADDEKGPHIVGTLGGPQELTVINEPGLYRAIFGSRVEAAERFKRWLAHEVLPQIRKTGRYEASDVTPTAPAPPLPDPWASLSERLAVLEQAIGLAERAGAAKTEASAGYAAAVSHLPIWSSNRRPRWWHDRPVRAAAIALHRQMTLEAACRTLEARFPDRSPSRSSLHRLWQRLDSCWGRGDRVAP